MLIFMAPAIIWMICRLMKKIMLTYPNGFNAWMCVITTAFMAIMILEFILRMAFMR